MGLKLEQGICYIQKHCSESGHINEMQQISKVLKTLIRDGM